MHLNSNNSTHVFFSDNYLRIKGEGLHSLFRLCEPSETHTDGIEDSIPPTAVQYGFKKAKDSKSTDEFITLCTEKHFHAIINQIKIPMKDPEIKESDDTIRTTPEMRKKAKLVTRCFINFLKCLTFCKKSKTNTV